VIFGHNFDRITDVKVGPSLDGHLYILSINPSGHNEGTIFRISPSNVIQEQRQSSIPPFFIY
jgi:hypothetical protein